MYLVLNKKTHLFTRCNGVDEAWKVMTDMLMDHSFRADIDVLSVEEENVKSAEAFAEMLGEPLPEESTPFPQSPDDCYIAVNIFALGPGERDINASVDLTFPVTMQEYDGICQGSWVPDELRDFIIKKAQSALQTAKRWPEVVGSCYEFNWGDAFMTDILEEALHAIPDEEVPDGIRKGQYGQYMRKQIIVNHDACFLQPDAPVRWVGYDTNGKQVAAVDTTLDMTSGSIDDFAFPDEVTAKIGADIVAARVFFEDGSSVDCNREEDFMKLREDENSVHLK